MSEKLNNTVLTNYVPHLLHEMIVAKLSTSNRNDFHNLQIEDDESWQRMVAAFDEAMKTGAASSELVDYACLLYAWFVDDRRRSADAQKDA